MTLARYRASRCNDVNRRANRQATELRPPVKVGLLDDSIQLSRYDARRLRPWNEKERRKRRASSREQPPRWRGFHCVESNARRYYDGECGECALLPAEIKTKLSAYQS